MKKKLNEEMFATSFDLVMFVNNKGIQKDDILSIVLWPEGTEPAFYVLFYYEAE